MDDLINRQAAIDAAIEAVDEWDGGYNLTRADMIADVINNNVPSTQPERKKGEWIPQNHNKTNGMMSTAVYYYPKCSVCGHCANYTNFCPNCGADMRERDDD